MGDFLGWDTIYGEDFGQRTPYMKRFWIGRLRLHIFLRGDNDPDCHDHMWDFWTFPLTPYVEEVVGLVVGEEPELRRQIVPAFRVSFRKAEHTHRVLGKAGRPPFTTVNNHWRVVPGKIVTLVWVSKKRRPWGFLKNRDGEWCWVPWRKYIYEGGKTAPCQPAMLDKVKEDQSDEVHETGNPVLPTLRGD